MSDQKPASSQSVASQQGGDTPAAKDKTPESVSTATTNQGNIPVVNVAGEKGLTEADLNKAAGAARADGESKGRKKLLEDLGFTDESELSGLIRAAKEREEAEKTEAERVKEQYDKLQTKHQSAQSRAKELESKARLTALSSAAQLAALEVGVRADRAQDIIAIASQQGKLSEVEVSETDTGFNPNVEALKEALSSVLGRYPEWLARGPQNVGGGGAGAPVAEVTPSTPDFAAMPSPEFSEWVERVKNSEHGIPLSDLR